MIHHLGQFVLHFHNHGIDTIAELRGCTDGFLAEEMNMKKAHILKFRRALKDAGEKAALASGGKMSVWEAVDGYRGTYEEVCAHEAKLERLAAESGAAPKYSLYEAADGFRGTYEEVMAHEIKHGLEIGESNDGIERIYEASDGFRGSYEAVHKHEEGLIHHEKNGTSAPAADSSSAPSASDPVHDAHHKLLNEPVVLRVYEAQDGFRGSYDDVIAYEKKNGMRHDDDQRLYEASDGFTGSYEETLKHEEGLLSKEKAAAASESMPELAAADAEFDSHHKILNSPVVFRIYEASDGYRGSYEDVLAREEKIESGVGFGGNDKHSSVMFRVYEASDGFRGSYEEVVEREGQIDAGMTDGAESGEVLFKLYEASDGFRGSYDDVVRHEERLASGATSDEGEVVLRVYEASDGFRGTFDEVVAHEEQHGLDGGVPGGAGSHSLYETVDGKFRGTFDECVAYEEKHGLVDSDNHAIAPHVAPEHNTVILRIYEASDGFRGSYHEVVEHEERVALSMPLLNDPAAKAAVEQALAVASQHKAEADSHKAELEKHKQELKMLREAQERMQSAAAPHPEVLTFNCEDGVDVSLGEAGKTLKIYSASYAAAGFNDVSAAVVAKTKNGVFAAKGGVHKKLGDPAPGVPKHFVVTYSIS